MRRLRKAALAVYLLAGVIVVAVLGGSLVGPYTDRVIQALFIPWMRILLLACLVIVSAHLLLTLIALFVDRPQPDCVCLDGKADIEVSSAAIASIARLAATDRDAMVESVEVRVTGRDKAAVRVDIEAIALVPRGLEGMARLMQRRVADACAEMLGMTDVVVGVRFLPAKTTVAMKE